MSNPNRVAAGALLGKLEREPAPAEAEADADADADADPDGVDPDVLEAFTDMTLSRM